MPSVGSTAKESTVSGLTLPSGVGGDRKANAPASAGKGIDFRIENDGFNGNLFGAYKISALKSKAIWGKIKAGTISALPFSKRDGTKPMCLAWHTKGVCNANCLCLYDHVVYSADKYAPMVAWCHGHGYVSP